MAKRNKQLKPAAPAMPQQLAKTSPAQQALKLVPTADASREYVSGGEFQVSGGARSLPFSADDVTKQVGADVYERMMTDAEVKSDYLVLRDSVLCGGMAISVPVSVEDADYDLAVEIADSLARSLNNLTRPFRETMEMLFEALIVGNKVAEKTYKLDGDGADKGRFVHASIKVKPRNSVAFVVDDYMEVVGFVYLDPRGRSTPAFSSFISANTHVLPRSKFVIATNDPHDEDPRGRSEFRAAYNPWNMKVQIYIEYLRYLLQFAMASVIGYTAPDANPVDYRNEAGQLVQDADGNPLQLEPEEAMLLQLLRLRNGTAGAFPYGSKIEPLQVGENGANFIEAFAFFDRQISKAITGQTLATQQGEHQARAAASTHLDVMEKRVHRLKTWIADIVKRDIAAQFVSINWGDAVAEKLTPNISFGETQESDWAAELTASAKAAGVKGWLSQSQKQWLAVHRLSLPAMQPGEEIEQPDAETMPAGNSGADSTDLEDATDEAADTTDEATEDATALQRLRPSKRSTNYIRLT